MGVYSRTEYTEFQKMCQYFNFTRIYMLAIAYYHYAKGQIEKQTPKMLISRFKNILYDYFDSCLIFKTPITQNSKITCFVNWRKRLLKI